eukprot:3731444-Rhodomonas_salina.2
MSDRVSDRGLSPNPKRIMAVQDGCATYARLLTRARRDSTQRQTPAPRSPGRGTTLVSCGQRKMRASNDQHTSVLDDASC